MEPIFKKITDLGRDDLAITTVLGSVSQAAKDLTIQKEEYLQGLVKALGITPEEFARDYLLEQYPAEISNTAQSVIADEWLFVIRETIRVRRKKKQEKEAGL